MSNPKKALIVEGGGSRGVFSFGVIDSFIQASYNPFDLHFGVSNGAVVQLWYILAYRFQHQTLQHKNSFLVGDFANDQNQ